MRLDCLWLWERDVDSTGSGDQLSKESRRA